jgi:heavy metal sensor kinase
MAYFFVLLAVSLGGVSILAYEDNKRHLQAKEDLNRKVLETEHHHKTWRVSAGLDNFLLMQARTLAGQVLFQFQRNRAGFLSPAAMLSMYTDPNGYLQAQFRLVESRMRGPWSEILQRLLAPEQIKVNEEFVTAHSEGHGKEYYQINTENGRSSRSSTLGELNFPFNAALFNSLPLHDYRFSDLELAPGVKVRRVLFKVPVARIAAPPPPNRKPLEPGMSGPPRPERRQEPRNPSTRPSEFTQPAILIQFASETTQRDAMLAELKADHEDKLAELKAESLASLANLRYRLWLLSSAAFIAILAGSFLLVRHGLSPLHRLSEAVSQVSAKDFRLPLDQQEMPRELRPIVARLTETLGLLKRTFAREKQAAADISHELRTPLSALLTTVEVGLRKPRTPEEYRELLADCHASGQQINQLVERMLALARLDAGMATLRTSEVDVAMLAQQCASLVRPLANARGLSLQVHGSAPVSLQADPDKLREVLTNLLHNAIEYNRPNGSVEVTVERENGHLELEVRDTGIGVAADVREHIFERFYRADPSRQADGLHAGLGLAIVKGYVDLMGGTITVDSTVGEGSAFRVRLPVTELARAVRFNESRN